MNVMLFASCLKTFGLWRCVVAPDGDEIIPASGARIKLMCLAVRLRLVFSGGRNGSGNKLAKHSAYSASRACASGPRPGISAGILNLPWLNAVPTVHTSGLSINSDALGRDELYVMPELRCWERTGQNKVL